MSKSGFFDLNKENNVVTVSCAGNLTVRGDAGSTVRYKGDGGPFDTDEQRIESAGNLKVQLPKGAHLLIKNVAGNVTIKGVQAGEVAAEGPVAGNFTVTSSDGDVVVQTVHGNARFVNVTGNCNVKGAVSGNLVAKNAGSLSVNSVHGDVTVKRAAGDVTVQQVGGNAGVRHVAGNLMLANVAGDVAIGDVSGIVDVKCNDDIRFSGSLVPGKHKLQAASWIDFRYPENQPLTVLATTDVLEMRTEFDSVVEEDDVTRASIGEDGPVVTLIAPERLRIRPISEADSDFNINADVDIDFDFADIEMDLSDLGERISAEVNARVAEITTNIGPEIGLKAERAIRAAQAAIERAANKVEIEVRRAEQRATRKPPAPPRPKPAPNPAPAPKPDSTKAQLEILKMLESGKISVEEANQLLAALG